MLTAAATNAAGLLAVRFFLGVAESPIAPGLTVVVAMWYKRSEQPLRHAAWFLGNTTAGIVGGLAAYGIGHVEGIAAWKVREKEREMRARGRSRLSRNPAERDARRPSSSSSGAQRSPGPWACSGCSPTCPRRPGS